MGHTEREKARFFSIISLHISDHLFLRTQEGKKEENFVKAVKKTKDRFRTV